MPSTSLLPTCRAMLLLWRARPIVHPQDLRRDMVSFAASHTVVVHPRSRSSMMGGRARVSSIRLPHRLLYLRLETTTMRPPVIPMNTQVIIHQSRRRVQRGRRRAALLRRADNAMITGNLEKGHRCHQGPSGRLSSVIGMSIREPLVMHLMRRRWGSFGLWIISMVLHSAGVCVRYLSA